VTLLIACLLINFMHLQWAWYAVAGGLWLAHLAFNPVVMKLISEWIASSDETAE
jgi:hypothetical protein